MAAQFTASDPPEEPESLEQSYGHYRAELVRYFLRQARHQSAAAAEDFVQQVYERLLSFPPQSPVRDRESYLFRVARNVLWDSNREARIERERYLTAEGKDLELFAHGLTRLWVQEDGGHDIAAREIERVLMQLPYVCRVAFIRQRIDGRTYQQIGDELGVSAHTARDYVAKAISQFHLHFTLSPTDPRGY